MGEKPGGTLGAVEEWEESKRVSHQQTTKINHIPPYT